jgi:hypothetical protein
LMFRDEDQDVAALRLQRTLPTFRSSLSGLHDHVICVGCNENGRHSQTARPQLLLHFETAHPGHHQVQK